jgi:N-acylneuraminate cytidylyltransferase
MKIPAIILARSGSKGIPRKNIIDFCGKPLLVWTIEQCLAGGVDMVYVSSDADEILDIGEKYGACSIKRPEEISDDEATSESGWLHALEVIEGDHGKVDWALAPQVTSPLRTADDIQKGLTIARSGQYDSLFSCSIAEDLFFWEDRNGNLESVNYDWQNRKRRQDIPRQYIENGSFYLFRPEILRQNNNRFGGKVGVVEMQLWKMFEIDSLEDQKMCSALMKEFLVGNK